MTSIIIIYLCSIAYKLENSIYFLPYLIVLSPIFGSIDIFGLYHLAAVRISKLELLSLINEQFDLGKTIVPKKLEFEIDRSLNGKKLSKILKLLDFNWSEMVTKL